MLQTVGLFKYILNKYIREFKVYANTVPGIDQSFPQVINNDKPVEIPTIMDGADVVFEENVMWRCMKKTMPLGLGNFYSVYINTYINDDLKRILNQIIEDRLI